MSFYSKNVVKYNKLGNLIMRELRKGSERDKELIKDMIQQRSIISRNISNQRRMKNLRRLNRFKSKCKNLNLKSI